MIEVSFNMVILYSVICKVVWNYMANDITKSVASGSNFKSKCWPERRKPFTVNGSNNSETQTVFHLGDKANECL